MYICFRYRDFEYIEGKMNQIQFYEAKLQFEIDSWDLNDQLKNEEKIIVIDTRSKDAYKLEHIPGAINIPHKEMNKKKFSKLNTDFLYVCYCDGIGCNASTKGALNLSRFGFKVKELMGGLEWWKQDGYTTKGKQGEARTQITCGC